MQILSRQKITDKKLHYSFGYYSANKWLADGRLVLIRGNTPEIKTDTETGAFAELVIYSPFDKSIITLAEGIRAFTDFLAFENKIYYIKGNALFEYNIDTCEEKKLFCEENIESPHITRDGKYISVFSCSKEMCRFFRVSVDDGKGELLSCQHFEDPNPYANHGMISPVDKDIIFFAHEGDTRVISDRLWIYNDVDKKAYNIAKQSVDESGRVMDCFGHESWAYDGCGMYFVKYRESAGQSGICYADIKGNSHELLYTGYDYWHVGASPSGKFLTADTRNLGGDRSGVVLIDLETKTEMLLDTPAVTFRHPCHPHPALSCDDDKLIFHSKNEYGNTEVVLLCLEH